MPLTTDSKFIVFARINDLERLTKAAAKNWGSNAGQHVIFDVCRKLFADALLASEVMYEGLQTSPGQASFIVGNALRADALARKIVEKFDARNGEVEDFTFHVTVSLAIATVRDNSSLATTHNHEETDPLLLKSHPGEIWISGAAFLGLSRKCQKDYEPASDGVPGAYVMRAGVASDGLRKKCVMCIDMAEFGRTQSIVEQEGGTVAVAQLQQEIKMIMQNGFTSAKCDYESACRDFGGDGGKFVFDEAEDAHRVAMEILHAAEPYNEEGHRLWQQAKTPKEKETLKNKIRISMRCFRVGIAYGELARDREHSIAGVVVTNAVRLEGAGTTGQVLMSPEAHQRLSPSAQQEYSGREMVRGKDHDQSEYPVHRLVVTPALPWEGEAAKGKRGPIVISEAKPDLPDCFVLSPLNPTDKRGKSVYQDLIIPACADCGFLARRADELPGSNRIDVISGMLSNAPLAIGYLGDPEPHWNSDVMLEVGYRFGRKLPIVLLSERSKEGRPFKELLPFYLANIMVLEVPKTAKAGRAALVAEIKTAIAANHKTDWNTLFPVMEYRFTNVQTDVVFTELSPEAKALFETEVDSNGRLTDRAREKFKARLTPAQHKAFTDERMAILRSIQTKAFGYDGSTPIAIPPARVPIVFKDDPPAANGKPFGYLPVIVRYLFKDGVMHMRTLYLRVSDSLRQDPAGHWVCEL